MQINEEQEIKKDIKDIKESLDFVVQNAATKEDLKQFATKEDLNKIDKKLDEKFNTVMNSIDAVMGELKSSRQEDIMKVGRDDRQDEEIGQVKNRVTAVEHRIGMEPMMA